jgi:hypothetical protein
MLKACWALVWAGHNRKAAPRDSVRIYEKRIVGSLKAGKKRLKVRRLALRGMAYAASLGLGWQVRKYESTPELAASYT